MDYALGASLIVSPWLLGFADDSIATWVGVIVGAGIVLLTAVTDDLSLADAIGMRTHLAIESRPAFSSPSRRGCSASPTRSGRRSS